MDASRKSIFNTSLGKKLSQRNYDLSYREKVVLWSDGTGEPVEGCFAP